MISQRLESLFFDLSASFVTDVLVILMGGVFFLAIYQANKGRHSHFLSAVPTLLTSLGILGTFLGIVIALLHFNTADIDKSIPLLLEGVKVAFISSVIGLGAAIIFNALDAWRFAPKRAANGVTSEVSPEDIHAVLEKQNGILEGIATGMSGQEEGSLVGQVRMLRADLGDFSKATSSHNKEFSERLWAELQNFAEMMAKGATEQVIEALRQVIVDFNNQLTEQFGDNFKRLDESVKKLVVWQVRYKDQVEKMGEQYQQSVDSLVHTREAVAGIWEECKEIPLAMGELKTVIQTNQHQIAELQRHLEAFVTMRDKAIEAVPTIQEKIENIGDLLHAGAVELQGSLTETGQQMLVNSNEMRVALEEGAEHFRNSVTTTQQEFSSMSKTVSEASDKLTETLSDTVQEMHNSARELLATMHGSVEEMGGQLKKHSTDLTAQFERAVVEFEQNAQRVVQQLGQSGSEAQQGLAQSVERMLNDLNGAMSKARAELDGHVTESLNTFSRNINAKLELFETSTMRELNSELETVGSALTSITGRFVDDYQKLVGRMDEVIRRQLERSH